MAKTTEKNSGTGQKLYRCQECGFHFQERSWAEKCEAWCRKYKSCSLKIAAHAEENK